MKRPLVENSTSGTVSSAETQTNEERLFSFSTIQQQNYVLSTVDTVKQFLRFLWCWLPFPHILEQSGA